MLRAPDSATWRRTPRDTAKSEVEVDDGDEICSGPVPASAAREFTDSRKSRRPSSSRADASAQGGVVAVGICAAPRRTSGRLLPLFPVAARTTWSTSAIVKGVAGDCRVPDGRAVRVAACAFSRETASRRSPLWDRRRKSATARVASRSRGGRRRRRAHRLVDIARIDRRPRRRTPPR